MPTNRELSQEERIAKADQHVAAKARAVAVDRPAAPEEATETEEEDWEYTEEDDRRQGDPSDHEIPAFEFEEEKKSPPYAIYGGVAAVLVLAAVGGFFLFGESETTDADTKRFFVQQMLTAPQGKGPKEHVFGGAITVGEMAGRVAITAEAVPSDACQSAAWTLASRGNVMISGVMPKRVQPAVLKELCSKGLLGATLIFLPRRKPK